MFYRRGGGRVWAVPASQCLWPHRARHGDWLASWTFPVASAGGRPRERWRYVFFVSKKLSLPGAQQKRASLYKCARSTRDGPRRPPQGSPMLRCRNEALCHGRRFILPYLST